MAYMQINCESGNVVSVSDERFCGGWYAGPEIWIPQEVLPRLEVLLEGFGFLKFADARRILDGSSREPRIAS